MRASFSNCACTLVVPPDDHFDTREGSPTRATVAALKTVGNRALGAIS